MADDERGESDDDILEEAQEAFEKAAEHEDENRRRGIEDLKFARLGEQWPDDVKKARELDRRPCLTINRMPAFIRQVVNDTRQNKPQIKVKPVDSQADIQTAKVLDGLIRNIEYTSSADIAYDTGVDNAATMGFGYLKVAIAYAHDDSFDKDIRIERVPNPLTIYGDPYATSADGSDWMSAFETTVLSKDEFERQYKDAKAVDWDDLGYTKLKGPWLDGDDVMVANWWKREEIARTILLLSDGAVVDKDVYEDRRDMYDALGLTVNAERSAPSYKVTNYLLTGAEVLETQEWPGRYIPIIPVYGEEVNVEGERHFLSLVHFAKDPQRMFNYWRSTTTELVALAPKAPFIGPQGAFVSDAKRWATANTESHAYLEYDGTTPPQRQPFAGVPAGALQEALNAADDMKSVIGLYDPSLGARSNETSGRAILARQREGDVSTFHFPDNLSRAITQMGRVIIDLIPHVYDGPRIIRTLGEDGTASSVPIKQPVAVSQNGPPIPAPGLQPNQPYMMQNGAPAPMPAVPPGQEPPTPDGFVSIFDLTIGKYDVAVDAGPSFTTRREEAAAQMIELLRAYPAVAPVIGDILAKNLDWPGAEEIAERLKSMIPQAGGPPPEMQQQLGELQSEVAKLTQQLQAERSDKAIEAEKLKISAFEAETARMKVGAEMQAVQQAQTVQVPQPMPHAEHGTMMLQAQKQLGDVAGAQMAVNDQTAKLGALAEQLAGLVQMMAQRPQGAKEIVIRAPSGGVYRGVVGERPN